MLESIPGRRLITVALNSPLRPRAKQEIDYGRRGRGSIFGAFVPATGETLPAPFGARSTANVVAFLEQVERWLDPTAERVYAVLDNLSAHRHPSGHDAYAAPVMNLPDGPLSAPKIVAVAMSCSRGVMPKIPGSGTTENIDLGEGSLAEVIVLWCPVARIRG